MIFGSTKQKEIVAILNSLNLRELMYMLDHAQFSGSNQKELLKIRCHVMAVVMEILAVKFKEEQL